MSLRIVAGQFRSMRLRTTPGSETRPTADRVREALFSMLGGQSVQAHVLDLFCGSGALALEALSRGAAAAVLVDRSRAAAATALKNAEHLGVRACTEVFCMDASRALQVLSLREQRFSLVFLDPPYDSPLLQSVLADQALPRIVEGGALIALEHRKGRQPGLGTAWRIWRQRDYGGTTLTIVEAASG